MGRPSLDFRTSVSCMHVTLHLTAWPRGGHSPGLDPGFVYAFSSSPSSRAHVSPAALNCSRLFSGPSLRVCGPPLWTFSVSWLVWLSSLGVSAGLWGSV